MQQIIKQDWSIIVQIILISYHLYKGVHFAGADFLLQNVRPTYTLLLNYHNHFFFSLVTVRYLLKIQDRLKPFNYILINNLIKTLLTIIY